MVVVVAVVVVVSLLLLPPLPICQAVISRKTEKAPAWGAGK